MTDRVTITLLEDGIADVRMNRPEKMNALDADQWAALVAAIDALKAMTGLRAIILSGEGKAFCAGLDLASMQAVSASGAIPEGHDVRDRTKGIANHAQYVAWGWRELPVPVIAAVHGVAFGAGSQIMAGADIRIVHPETRIAIMELKWGIVPDVAGFALWRSHLRDDVLRELVYTHREVRGAEAQALGLATHISADPYADALAMARHIANKNPEAIRGAKRLLNLSAEASAADILLAESVEQLAVIRTPNQIEAVMAEMEKRKPVFHGG